MESLAPRRTDLSADAAPDRPAGPPRASAPMSAEQRQRFEEDGYLVLRGVLSPADVERYAAAVDVAYRRDVAAGGAAGDGSLQRQSAVANCPPLAELVDHPWVLPLVWSVLGWNVHVVHSHYNVHPPVRGPETYRWRWHQDGGRQNVDLETDPRPRLSVFAAFWLTDVSRPGRGNLRVIPGSHTRNWLPGPPRPEVEAPEPDGAQDLLVGPGDVVFFDRRLWHTRTPNRSDVTRKAVFFGYSYRWIGIRDEVPSLPARSTSLNPIRRQLLGVADLSGDGRWGLHPDTVPLYVDLKERGLLDPDYRPHRRFYP